jgi:GTP:adenosylcobinamide-phosphate guanylyltransferase
MASSGRKTFMPADAALPFTAIILAAQRSGRLDPLAAEAGVTHKCLVPILERPLIQYVLEALAPVPGLERIRICIEPEAVEPVRAIPGASGIRVDFVPSRETITDSAYASAEGVDGPFLITTADNVNLTPSAVEEMMQSIAAGADCAIGLAARGAVLAARADAELGFTDVSKVGPYRFSDDSYSNCNLYAMAGPQVLKMAEAFREGGQFSKNRERLIRFVGLFNILLYRFKLMTLSGAMKRLSRRFGLKVEAVVLEDGAQAVDVDNARTYKIAEAMLRRKRGLKG